MTDTPRDAQEGRAGAAASDGPGRTQEPLQSHTCCLENNAAGPSSEEHEYPLNGTQPNPFVYSCVPAVRHAGDSLPSGALVNGPASHPTSEERRVPNKGSPLSNNGPDAAWRVEEDTSPEVLPPPGELQSDARRITAGLAVQTPATRPGVDTPPPHAERNESKLACSTLSADPAEPTHIRQPRSRQTVEPGSRPQSSSDDEGIRYDSAAERRLRGGRRQQTAVTHRREKQHNADVESTSDFPEKVKSRSDDADGRSCRRDRGVVAVGDVSSDRQSDCKYSVMPFRDLRRNAAFHSERKHGVYRASGVGCDEHNDPDDKNSLGGKVEQRKTQEVGRDPSLFSCTICNVNLQEKRHFHRHLMYHLAKHNQTVSQAFICRECGRLFCDRSSLMRHVIIHQERLEKLMLEIKGLRNPESEGGGASARCPHPAFGCNPAKILVQRAKTRNNLKHYYFCEECDYITLTQQALELHLHVAHLGPRRKTSHASAAEEAGRVQLQCKMGFFTNHQTRYEEFPQQPKVTACRLWKSAFGETDLVSKRSTQDANVRASSDQTFTCPQVKRCTLSPSVWRISGCGKLLLQSAETFEEEENDAERKGHKDFGSFEQENHPEAADALLSDGDLKLDPLFRERGEKLENKTLPNRKSPSIRSTATPLRHTVDKVNGGVFARLSQRLKKGHDIGEASGSCWENQRNPYARRYFRKRQRFSSTDQNPRLLQDDADGDEDCSDIEQLVIKEEFVEAAVCEDPPGSPPTPEVSSSPLVQHKPCPYCPATFESGVALSNHVRGHLHRVGLSYDARHTVPPEQVALRDHRPRPRRRASPAVRRMRKAAGKAATAAAQTCPLCRGWFDSPTGLSNHVRGHLKRIGGGGGGGGSKSPLCVLNELLRDKKEHENMRRRLDEGHAPPRPPTPRGVSGSSGVVLMRTPLCEMKQEEEAGAGRGVTASSALVQLLRSKREAPAVTQHHNQTHTTEHEGADWTPGERDSEKICLQPDRKRLAEGCDHKQKKLKPRPGLKKKILPSLSAQVYRLTCRFCDLVFQGPLSIQEDWIRHLQRHLQHAAVPHSGTTMVEVLGSWTPNTNQ